MGPTACTEPRCLYSRAIPLLPLWAVQPIQSLSTCTRVHFTYFFGMSVCVSVHMKLFENHSVYFKTFDVQWFVHYSINHLEITNKMRPCIRIYYSISYCSTCFERHIAHHQEFKLCLQPLVLHTSVVAGCWQRPSTTDVCKTRGCKHSKLLMMSDVSLETCWAIRNGIINSNTWLHLVGYFSVIYFNRVWYWGSVINYVDTLQFLLKFNAYNVRLPAHVLVVTCKIFSAWNKNGLENTFYAKCIVFKSHGFWGN
jgi:hypothetical protein